MAVRESKRAPSPVQHDFNSIGNTKWLSFDCTLDRIVNFSPSLAVILIYLTREFVSRFKLATDIRMSYLNQQN